MRNIIFMLLVLVAFHSCTQKQVEEQYSIQIELDGVEGRWLKLKALEDRNYVVYDSVFAEAGTIAEMSKSSGGVTTMYLTTDDNQHSIQLLIENAEYKISGTLEAPLIQTNSKAQNDLNAYNETLKSVREEIKILRDAYLEARQGDNPHKTDSLRDAYYTVYEKQESIDAEYVVNNPSSYASVLALRSTFYNLNMDQLDEILSSLDPHLHQMKEYEYMNGKLERMKAVAIGKPYTDFELATPEGGSLKVSDVHNGNVLLIDFWASWCGPCRVANPELVEIYHDYHERGFEILGVSLDRDTASWVKGIEEDNLVWPQISDLKYWNSAGAVLYGVPAIPHTVLIDREGIITAKKLHGNELREAIESLL